MSDEDDTIDPEVERDLRLRAATERERRSSYSETSRWRPPAIVGQWRCRVPACRAWVDVPDAAMDAFATHNAKLRARGEEPLDKDQILFCDRCRDEYVRSAPDRRRGQVERMRVAIIELKDTGDPERQRELLDQIRALHHPDIDGLERWLRENARSASSRRPRREL